MPAIMNQPVPDNNSHKPKPKAKRVITEARKIQNREAQRAYRLRQKERQRAQSQKEAIANEQCTSSRSSSACQLRPQPPVGKSPDSIVPIFPPSWSFPIQDVDASVPGPAVVEDQSNGEIISPQAHDLNLTAALNLSLAADPLSVPLPGSNLPTPDGSIGVPEEPHAFSGFVDMELDMDMQIDPLLSGVELFPQSSSDINSHVSTLDGFLPMNDQLLYSFQQESSNIQTDIEYDYASNNQPISTSTSNVPSVPTQSQPQPARRDNSHDAKQTSRSACASTSKPAPKSTSKPATRPATNTNNTAKPMSISQSNATSKSTSKSIPNPKPVNTNPNPPALPNPHTNHLTPLATFFLTGTMYNAHCLGMSIEQFFSLECNSLGSPFYQRVTSASTDPKMLLASVIAANPFIPTYLRPTLPQILIEHHPIFDLIPLANLRSRAIIMSATMPGLVDMMELKKDIISGGLVCRGSGAGKQERGIFQMGVGMGLGVGSGQPWDLRSWEVSDWFWRKWRLLFDGEGEESGGDLWG